MSEQIDGERIDVMTERDLPAMIQTVVATLRHVSATIFAGGNEADAEWLYSVADQIEQDRDYEHWGCCPLCEETICDEGCPLKPIGRWETPGV